MPSGRPLNFKTPEDLEKAITDFFYLAGNTPTISGLALYLGFSSRQSFYNYEERKEFLDIIKKARLEIESYHEKKLFDGNCTGSIFWLKNSNKGSYSDKEDKEKTNDQTTPTKWTDDE